VGGGVGDASVVDGGGAPVVEEGAAVVVAAESSPQAAATRATASSSRDRRRVIATSVEGWTSGTLPEIAVFDARQRVGACPPEAATRPRWM
jgi:hypothetical protein